MPIPESYFSGQPLHIGAGTHLLLDDELVEDRWALERVLHPPEKFPRNPVLLRDKPWEGDVAYRPWVLFDEERQRYRMWYQCFSFANYYGAAGPPYYLAYAESRDGYEWEKPRLDVCPGCEGTNIVYRGHHYGRVQGAQVFRDEAEPDAGRRYKMVCLERYPLRGELASGVGLCVSPDGLRWRPAAEAPILDYHSDCHNHVAHDPDAGRWLLYCRPIHLFAAGRKQPEGQVGGRHMKRRVAVMASPDFKEWSYPRAVLCPDERDPPDYDSVCVFRYARQFLMFYAAMEGEEAGTNEARLAFSRDGLHWRRFHGRTPFLARGREGDWDAGQVIADAAPVPQGDDLLIYYSSFNAGQYTPSRNGGIGLARMVRDRFVEQRAGDRPGYLLTREFVLEGNRLSVNAVMPGRNYAEQGLRAEIVRRPELGRHGAATVHAVEGFGLEDCEPVRGSRPDAPLRWKGSPDLGALRGQAVYLRFEIRNMGLFAFRVYDE